MTHTHTEVLDRPGTRPARMRRCRRTDACGRHGGLGDLPCNQAAGNAMLYSRRFCRGGLWQRWFSYPEVADTLLATRPEPWRSQRAPKFSEVVSRSRSGNRASGQIRPQLADLGKTWPNNGRDWPHIGTFRQTLADLGDSFTKFGHTRPTYGSMPVDEGRMLVNLDHVWPNVCPNRISAP